MPRINHLFFLFVIIGGLFTSCQSSEVEIYVSPNGDDKNSGTIELPVQSIEAAKLLANQYVGKNRVSVILKDGIYYLPKTVVFEPENSGTEKCPIIYRAENEGKAIISGGVPLQLRWEAQANGIYKANITDNVEIDQLYINGKRQRMARFPNAIEGKNVFDTWDLKHTNDPDPENDPLSEERIALWSNPKGAYVHVMHGGLWGDMHWLVKGKNEDGSLDMEGGWQNNRPAPMHPRYRMVENVFEELDAPHEWYYNRDEKTLYYYPDAKTDISKAVVEVVRLKHLFEFNGTKEDPVKFLTLDGLVYRHTARSFMENKEPLLRSDWTTYRGGAVFFNGAEDCSVLNGEFDQVGGNSIFVNNYNRRISIKSCYIHHSGANGIAFVGDPKMVRSPLFRYGNQDFEKIDRTPGPLGDNYPADCLVEDCLITLTGRDEKQTAPVQISMSYRIRVNHCSIYDVPRAGININEGTFGGHIIENCDVFNTVLETGDHGSFNSWGRDRFWTPSITKTAEEVKKMPELPKLDMLDKNIIRNSRWRCDHGWDIDLDDGSTWYRIYNNVLLNGGLKMREGYDRVASNNIIINSGLHPHVWYPESGDVFKNNIVFTAHKEAIMNRGIAKDGKWGKEIDFNLFVSSEKNKNKYNVNSCDSNSIIGNPLFVNVETGDYTVKENSPAFKIGFKNFPMDQFGVVSPKLKKIAKTPEFPTVNYTSSEKQGETYQWYGATVKDVETAGEQSAAGLPSISGVILLEVPEYSKFAKSGFDIGDVILACEGETIDNFKQLEKLFKYKEVKKSLKFKVSRNQKVMDLTYEFGTE